MNYAKTARDVNPSRRDPYRLHFEDFKGDNLLPADLEITRKRTTLLPGRKHRMSRAQQRKKFWKYSKLIKETEFSPTYYSDPEEEEYYGEDEKQIEREWENDVIAYNRHKVHRSKSPMPGERRLHRIKKSTQKHKRIPGVLYKKKNYVPPYDNEYQEENFNPEDQYEMDYRPGWEGGLGYPKRGNYGNYYGERGHDFADGYSGTESQSPYASGYQTGYSYEGEHGYGETEDLGTNRRNY